MTMDYDLLWRNRHLLWIGLQYSLKLFAVVIVLGTAIGIIGGVGLLYGNRAIKVLIRLYVDVIRGLPLLVTIFLLYYVPTAYHVNLSGFESISLALSLFAGAHMSETVRGAIGSISKGQTDAAKSIGLTFWPRFFSVLLPQGLPLIIAPWTNLAVDMFKATSLAILVSQGDFLFSIQKRAIAKGHYLSFYIAGMVVYFIICFVISRAGAWLSRRLNVGMAA
jgi:polar amino acid transport system permease protein